jgi:hypothetical protein
MARRFNPALLKMLERKRERKRLHDRGEWSRQRKPKKTDLPKIRTGIEADAPDTKAGPVPFHVEKERMSVPATRPGWSRPESISPRPAGLYAALRLEVATRAAKERQKKRRRRAVKLAAGELRKAPTSPAQGATMVQATGAEGACHASFGRYDGAAADP